MQTESYDELVVAADRAEQERDNLLGTLRLIYSYTDDHHAVPALHRQLQDIRRIVDAALRMHARGQQ